MYWLGPVNILVQDRVKDFVSVPTTTTHFNLSQRHSMTSLRRQVLNEARSQTGAIVDEMKSYALTPVANDGMNIYGNVRINPITSGPFTNSQD